VTPDSASSWSYPEAVTTQKRPDGTHQRPPEELGERIAIPLDPATVIEGMMQVDADKVREAEPKRDRRAKS
jgi:hypothetical protein